MQIDPPPFVVPAPVSWNSVAFSVLDRAEFKKLLFRPEVVIVKRGPAAGVWYWEANSTTPPDDSTALACTNGPAGRYIRLRGGPFNVKWFGDVGLGINYDDDAIALALDVCDAAGGGIVYFPPGTYRISRPIVVGNGSDAAQSTKHHCIWLVGFGAGVGAQVSNVRIGGVTRVLYDGPADVARGVIEFAGPLHNIGLRNLVLDANGKAGKGLLVNHCLQATFKRMVVVKWTGIAYDLTTRAGFPYGVAYGNAEHIYEQCFSYDPANNTASGVRLTSGAAGGLVNAPDTCRTTWLGGTIVYGGSTGSRGFWVHGADNNNVWGTLPIPAGGHDGGGHSIFFEQWAATPVFPLENTFINVAGQQPIGGVSGTLGNFLWPLPTSDGVSGPATIANLVYLTSDELRGKQIIAHANGDGNGFEAYALGATPIFGLTRKSNGLRITSFDDIRLAPGAVTGPASGTDVVTITANGLALPGGKHVRTAPVTVATLPSAAAAGAGARLCVSDADSPVWRSPVVGGGSSFAAVVSDAANWLCD